MIESLVRRLTAIGRAHPRARWPILALMALLYGLDALTAASRRTAGTLRGVAAEASAHLRETGRALTAGAGRPSRRRGEALLPLAYARGREALHASRHWTLSHIRMARAGAPLWTGRAKTAGVRACGQARTHGGKVVNALRAELPALRRHAPRRAAAAGLTLCMLLTLLPVSALAAEQTGGAPADTAVGDLAIELTALEGAPAEEQTAAVDGLDALDLPVTLAGVYALSPDDGTGAPDAGRVDIPTAWEGLPDPAVKGVYTLTAKLTLPEGYVLAEGVEPPTVALTLTAAPEEEFADASTPGETPEAGIAAVAAETPDWIVSEADGTVRVSLQRDVSKTSFQLADWGSAGALVYILDLNGHKLLGTGTSDMQSVLYIAEGAALTIEGEGTVQGSGGESVLDNYGTLTLKEGVTVLDESAADAAAVDDNNMAYTILTHAGSQTTVDGAEVQGSNATARDKTPLFAINMQNGGNLTVKGGVIRGGRGEDKGGAEAVFIGQTDTSARTIVIEGGELIGGDSVSGDGGHALYNQTDGSTITISGGTLTGGSSQNGTGGYALFNGGSTNITMTDGSATGGSGVVGGRGAYFYKDLGGTLHLEGGSITGGMATNPTKFGGVGIYMQGTNLTIGGGTVTGGSAANYGGDAINLWSGDAAIGGGLIEGGGGREFGGCGIYTQTTGTVAISGGLIAGGEGDGTSTDDVAGFGLVVINKGTVSISGGAFACQAAQNSYAVLIGGGTISNLLEGGCKFRTLSGGTADDSGTSLSGSYFVASDVDPVELPVIDTPMRLALVLNGLQPDAAARNGSTVTLQTDVEMTRGLTFSGGFDGALSMGGHRITGELGADNPCLYHLVGNIEGNPKLTVTGGILDVKCDQVAAVEGGALTLNGTEISVWHEGLMLKDGALDLTGATVSVADQGQFPKPDTENKAATTYALMTSDEGVTIHSGVFRNEFATGATYYGDGVSLASCVAEGSVSVPADSAEGDYGAQVCRQTITVTKGAPGTLKVTYNGNGSDGGTVPTDPNSPYKSGAAVTVLGNTGNLTKTGHAFSGWGTAATGGILYAAGDTFPVTAGTTLYAQWTPARPVYGVAGRVTDHEGDALENASVKLMRGSEQLGGTAATGADGAYQFSGIPAGVYNVVASVGEKTRTILATVTDTDLTEKDLRMPSDNKNSVVEVKDDDKTPAVAVGGLDEIAEEETAAPGGTVTVKLAVEAKEEENAAGATDIKAIAGAQTLDTFLDLSLTKRVDMGAEEDIGGGNTTVLEIVVPYDFTGKERVSVYRYHGGAATPLAALSAQSGPRTDGTFYADQSGGYLYLYAAGFSTYAIAYTPASVTPPAPPTASGGDSGDSDPAVYPPKLAGTENGAVSVSPKSPEKGDRVTVTVEPDEGYEVEKISVSDHSGRAVAVAAGEDGTYTFTQPGGRVTVTVTFRPVETRPAWEGFTDVGSNDWFCESVRYVSENGLMNGTASGKFSPEQKISRGMIVTILWRLEGEPEAKSANPFPDVAADAYCAKAAAWGAENGIVKDNGSGGFAPNDPITREQLALILHRHAQYRGEDTPTGGMVIDSFTDGAQASPWARDAMQWCLGQGIVSGKGNNRLDPQGIASRAEAAAMLQRYLTRAEA